MSATTTIVADPFAAQQSQPPAAAKPADPAPKQWSGHSVRVVADIKSLRYTLIAAVIIAAVGVACLAFSSPVIGSLALVTAVMAFPIHVIASNRKINVVEEEIKKHMKVNINDLPEVQWTKDTSGECTLKNTPYKSFRGLQDGKLAFYGFISPQNKYIRINVLDPELKKSKWKTEIDHEIVALTAVEILCNDPFDPNGKMKFRVSK